MLRHITIKSLFHLYDYEITMTSGDGNPIQDIMFLTGPNGMGKSTILHSVASVYKRDFGYFSTFPFEHMSFDFDACIVDITQITTIDDVAEDSDIPGSKTVRIVCDYMTKSEQPVNEHGEWGYRDGIHIFGMENPHFRVGKSTIRKIHRISRKTGISRKYFPI